MLDRRIAPDQIDTKHLSLTVLHNQGTMLWHLKQQLVPDEADEIQ